MFQITQQVRGAFVAIGLIGALATAAVLDAACGDGVLDPGEACDHGTANGLDACRSSPGAVFRRPIVSCVSLSVLASGFGRICSSESSKGPKFHSPTTTADSMLPLLCKLCGLMEPALIWSC